MATYNVWGQVHVGTTAPASTCIIVGSMWLNTANAPITGICFCKTVGPVTWTLTVWNGAGVPAFAATNGDVYHDSGGGVGTSIYKYISAAWVPIA